MADIKSIYAVNVDAAMDAACSPLTSQGPESFPSDNEAVDYHQDESVRKCNKHCGCIVLRSIQVKQVEIRRFVSEYIHLSTGRRCSQTRVEQCCSSLHGNNCNGLQFVRDSRHPFHQPRNWLYLVLHRLQLQILSNVGIVDNVFL